MQNPDYPHDHDCDCDHCHEHEHHHGHHHEHDGLGGGGSGGGGQIVTDYTALLRYLDSPSARWNGPVEVGVPVVVSYSFTAPGALPATSGYNPYGASGYWSYSETQKDHFRAALDSFSSVSGLMFAEIDGPAMINIYGAQVAGVGGWANYAASTLGFTGQGALVNAYSGMAPGQYGYQVNLHELGHTLGLSHPHDGSSLTLDPSVDTQANTVMTYNISYDAQAGGYARDLGGFDLQALEHLYGPASGQLGWTVGTSGANVVEISASDRSETILATGQDTFISGRRGHDTIIGREGDDILWGEGGRDTIIGGIGADMIRGGNADDLIYGDFEAPAYAGASKSP
jgi:hypothetical protein